jgi:hypothetical protein
MTAAEKVRPRRSQLARILNVPLRVRLRFLLRLRPCWTNFLSSLPGSLPCLIQIGYGMLT